MLQVNIGDNMHIFDLRKNQYTPYLSFLQDEIIYGGYLAALCSPAFIIFVSLLAHIKISLPILAIAYFIPLIVYSYDYYRDMDKDMATNLERAAHYNKKNRIYPLILFGYVATLIVLFLFFGNLMLISFVIVLVMIGVLYTVALKNFTRKIPVFKNIYTALTWSLAGAFFLPLYYSININPFYLLIFLFIFLKCLPNMIFFDIKDLKGDKKEGLKTLPVILGKENTLLFLKSLNLLAFIPLFIGIYLKIIPLSAVSMIFFFFYSLYYLNTAGKADDKELRMISYTMADFEFILWPLVLLITIFLI